MKWRPGRFVALRDGLCKGLPMSVQGHNFEADCFAIPLKGFDVVLRIRWLNSLGRVIWDGTTCTVEFQISNTTIKWHGEASTREDEGAPLNVIGTGIEPLENWFTDEEEIFTTTIAINFTHSGHE